MAYGVIGVTLDNTMAKFVSLLSRRVLQPRSLTYPADGEQGFFLVFPWKKRMWFAVRWATGLTPPLTTIHVKLWSVNVMFA